MKYSTISLEIGNFVRLFYIIRDQKVKENFNMNNLLLN